MRCAVLSDVHGNLEALEAVLRDVRRTEARTILFLGDAIGYGPDPNQCVHLLEAECSLLLAGNHDWAAVGLTSKEYFNPYARAAIDWTARVIERSTVETVNSFALTAVMKEQRLRLVHATPHEPQQWHYLLTLWDAEVSFGHFDERVCLIGHTHQPLIIERFPSGEMVTERESTAFGETERYIVNVGSVGQPRDGDPRACYAVIDDKGVEIRRVAYDVGETQRKMRQAALPVHLIERLSRGL